MAITSGKSVRITLSFKRESDGLPVVFKSDGQRFESQLTIKFQQDETYRVEITVRPPLPVESLRIQEEKIDLEKMAKFIDPNALSYGGLWKTVGMAQTEKNKRTFLKLSVSLWKSGTFTTSLQTKFYPHPDVQHARWGDKLNFVEYECTIGADGTITPLKQQIV